MTHNAISKILKDRLHEKLSIEKEVKFTVHVDCEKYFFYSMDAAMRFKNSAIFQMAHGSKVVYIKNEKGEIVD